MPNYRRVRIPGGRHFFTLVTAGRRPILVDQARPMLRAAFRSVQEELPFTIDAIVLLPEHLHAIWTLPEGDVDYSRRWGKIKKRFTRQWLAAGGGERPVSSSQSRERRRGVWQPRFWEHAVRDARELERLMDYVHFNPVKHGLVECPHLWKWSSFERCVRAGLYTRDWGCRCEDVDSKPMTFDDVGYAVGE